MKSYLREDTGFEIQMRQGARVGWSTEPIGLRRCLVRDRRRGHLPQLDLRAVVAGKLDDAWGAPSLVGGFTRSVARAGPASPATNVTVNKNVSLRTEHPLFPPNAGRTRLDADVGLRRRPYWGGRPIPGSLIVTLPTASSVRRHAYAVLSVLRRQRCFSPTRCKPLLSPATCERRRNRERWRD